MVPPAEPDFLSVLLCLVALQSVWRRRRCPSCQAGQWSGEVTAVTSALPGGGVRIKVSGYLCIKCSCDLVGRCGDLVRVAS